MPAKQFTRQSGKSRSAVVGQCDSAAMPPVEKMAREAVAVDPRSSPSGLRWWRAARLAGLKCSGVDLAAPGHHPGRPGAPAAKVHKVAPAIAEIPSTVLGARGATGAQQRVSRTAVRLTGWKMRMPSSSLVWRMDHSASRQETTAPCAACARQRGLPQLWKKSPLSGCSCSVSLLKQFIAL